MDLLKLHGSFNWGWCRNCKTYSMNYGGDFRDISASKCGRCQSDLVPVLVPPTRKKSQHLAALKPLWEKARAVLSVADTLCVVGYSFNKVDSEAIDLFEGALRKNGNLQSLLVADPHCRSIVERAYDFLGRRIENTVMYTSFEEMMAQLVGPMKGLLR